MKVLPSPQREIVWATAETLEKEGAVAAAKLLSRELDLLPPAPEESKQFLLAYFKTILDAGYLIDAARLIWPPAIFDVRPLMVRQVWEFFDATNYGMIMGAASVGKSYTLAARLFLEWLRDPRYTMVRVVAPTADHLEANLFSQLISLHRDSLLPLPGKVRRMIISVDLRSRRGSIKGLVIPRRLIGRAGKLQGVKRFPRPRPHPEFGALARLFLFIDEIENVADSVWTDIDNLLANAKASDDPHDPGFKIFGAFNPTTIDHEVAKRCEPPFGWGAFDPDVHYLWTSVRGWKVLRLDALKSENVIAGKVIYPGFQTREGIEQIIRNSGGEDSPGYYSMVRGCYPPRGTTSTIISPKLFEKSLGEYIWHKEDDTELFAGIDVALEGSSTTVIAIGRYGRAAGVRLPPLPGQTAPRTIYFRRDNRPAFIYGVQLEELIQLPKGSTLDVKEAIINALRPRRITPENVMMDRTAAGQGVYDLVRLEYGPVNGCNFSERATEHKILAEDTKTPLEEYGCVHTELWFALRKWMEFGYFLIKLGLDTRNLFTQLTGRRYRFAGKFIRIERKDSYRCRVYSVDEADAVTLMLHAVRMKAETIPSMYFGDYVERPLSGPSMTYDPVTGRPVSEDDSWWKRVDVTNRFEMLEVY